jgi:hypothetical protein
VLSGGAQHGSFQMARTETQEEAEVREAQAMAIVLPRSKATGGSQRVRRALPTQPTRGRRRPPAASAPRKSTAPSRRPGPRATASGSVLGCATAAVPSKKKRKKKMSSMFAFAAPDAKTAAARTAWASGRDATVRTLPQRRDEAVIRAAARAARAAMSGSGRGGSTATGTAPASPRGYDEAALRDAARRRAAGARYGPYGAARR